MTTTYKFNGTITLKQLLKMKDDINKKSVKEIGKNIISFNVGYDLNDKISSCFIESSIKEIGEKNTNNSLLLEFNSNQNVIHIERRERGNPQWLLKLIEYYSDVKIWDEYDLLDLENWIGVYDEHYEKLYIYSRVSTEVQSTDNQIDLGVKVSENLGLKPITFDEGHSSSNLDTIDQTPKLKELMSMVVNGEISNLWVHSMDRLSRNNSVSNYIRKTLKENNVRLYVGNSNEYDMGNHNDKLVMEEIMKCFP